MTDKKPSIPVVVVESHHHVLEHIHYLLRKLSRHRHRARSPTSPPTKWRMLHFDAHADLACPKSSIPAGACFRPRHEWNCGPSLPPAHSEKADVENETNDDDGEATGRDLYDMLETTTGIAEWILPLVLAGDLTHVEWVQPSGQPLMQLGLGQKVYHVGAWWPGMEEEGTTTSFMDLPDSAQVKVDWDCIYYRDDEEEDCYVPTNSLQLAKSLCLYITNSNLLDSQASLPCYGTDPWLLDICLDYFVCVNPFFADLEQVSAPFAQTLRRVVLNADVVKGKELDAAPFDRLTFLRLNASFQQILQRVEDTLMAKGMQEKLTEKQSAELLLWMESTLGEFYNSRRSSSLWEEHESKQQIPFSLSKNLSLMLTSLSSLSVVEISKVCAMAREALFYLHLPHFPAKEAKDLDTALDALNRRLGALDTNNPPFLVTIARSRNDGFTPETIVQDLQQRVLDCVHDRFCGCQGRARWDVPDPEPSLSNGDATTCSFRLLFDYGEWEGSSFEEM